MQPDETRAMLKCTWRLVAAPPLHDRPVCRACITTHKAFLHSKPAAMAEVLHKDTQSPGHSLLHLSGQHSRHPIGPRLQPALTAQTP